jgi:hypothetical protein
MTPKQERMLLRGYDKPTNKARLRYRECGIDVDKPDPDGSDYHLMNAIDDQERARMGRTHTGRIAQGEPCRTHR